MRPSRSFVVLFVRSVPLWAGFAVPAVILVMLAVDLLAHRKAHLIGVRETGVLSIV